jgi:hypothetical protein
MTRRQGRPEGVLFVFLAYISVLSGIIHVWALTFTGRLAIRAAE